MRRLWLALPLVTALAIPAAAQQVQTPRISFWEKVATPHAEKIARLRLEGNNFRGRAAQYYDVLQIADKNKYLQKALDKFEAAAALAPDRADLIRDVADVAHDLGDHEKAIASYLEILELQPDERTFELHRRLAASYMQTLRWDDAEDVLERALGNEIPNAYERAVALQYLGYVYMAEGRLDDAIDAYQRASASQRYGYYGGGGADLSSLAGLAVAYDRDEQVARAAEVLQQVQQLDPQFQFLLPNAYYRPIPFSPPSDRHYWLALAYEHQKKWTEAAVEWRAYIESADPLYERRAQEHLRVVNKELARKARANADAARKKGKDTKLDKPRKPAKPK